MKKTAIVSDTNSGISPQEAEQLGITMVPMPFFVDGVQHFEGITCTAETFFERLESGAEVSTSQPSPADITQVWDKLLEEYESLLYFPMSSALSGTCQTAKALAEDYPGRVYVVDNQRISVPQYCAVLDAKKLLNEGMSVQEVHAILEREARNNSIYIAVNTLAHLKKSGRVTAAGAAMATVLNLKPVLQIQNGKLDAYKKVRGMAQAQKVMLEAIRKDMDERFHGVDVQLCAAYSGLPDVGARWLSVIQEAFPDRTVALAPLPISICCHTGAGATAIGCAKIL